MKCEPLHSSETSLNKTGTRKNRTRYSERNSFFCLSPQGNGQASLLKNVVAKIGDDRPHADVDYVVIGNTWTSAKLDRSKLYL